MTNYSDRSISFVSVGTADLYIEATIKVWGTPNGVALTADGATAVVSLYNISAVAIIDVPGRSFKTIVWRGLGLTPVGVAIVSVP